MAIIEHRNYTPRLVQLITTHPEAKLVTAKDFVPHVLARLSDPGLIWRHVFENQLDEACRVLLICMASLPDAVVLDHLHKCVTAYFGNLDHRAWRAALKTLDVTFLSYFSIDGRQMVVVADPSLRDFVIEWLAENPDALDHLIETAAFFEQVVILWELTRSDLATGASRRSSPSIAVLPIEDSRIAHAAATLAQEPPAGGVALDLIDRTTSLASLAASLLAEELDGALERQLNQLEDQWISRPWQVARSIGVFEAIAIGGEQLRRRFARHSATFKEQLAESLEDLEDFEALVRLEKCWPEVFAQFDLASYQGEFLKVVDREIDAFSFESDREVIQGGIEDIEALARSFGIDIGIDLMTLEDRINELEEMEDRRSYEDWSSIQPARPTGDQDSEIEEMFQTL